MKRDIATWIDAKHHYWEAVKLSDRLSYRLNTCFSWFFLFLCTPELSCYKLPQHWVYDFSNAYVQHLHGAFHTELMLVRQEISSWIILFRWQAACLITTWVLVFSWSWTLSIGTSAPPTQKLLPSPMLSILQLSVVLFSRSLLRCCKLECKAKVTTTMIQYSTVPIFWQLHENARWGHNYNRLQ